MLIECTQERVFDPSKELRYADTRKDEQERELSMDHVVIFVVILRIGIKSTPLTLVLEDLNSKYALNTHHIRQFSISTDLISSTSLIAPDTQTSWM